ncbi:hypothetical protein ATO7_14003 [Oceanococcus atlanticus]|uniref:MoaD/ThiS family protein n=1 Tax=Oceanococcus atlanticus TaxID=1317117 RepID=A0A1Y1SDJ4_9GAMM|nr:hypothetical protein [Oceanococcus atlanticus]ORE86416.1 hypothetical protein ATO7_14003 [Oceanococcus atlanticus]
MHIAFYGQIADIAGHSRHFDVPETVSNLQDLLDCLGRCDAVLAEALGRPGIFLAIDDVIVGPDADLRGARQVVIGSVISGG